MIATISPSHKQYQHTVNTLKYANRAKEIKTRVRVRQSVFVYDKDAKDTMLLYCRESCLYLKKCFCSMSAG